VSDHFITDKPPLVHHATTTGGTTPEAGPTRTDARDAPGRFTFVRVRLPEPPAIRPGPAPPLNPQAPGPSAEGPAPQTPPTQEDPPCQA